MFKSTKSAGERGGLRSSLQRQKREREKEQGRAICGGKVSVYVCLCTYTRSSRDEVLKGLQLAA